MGGRSESRTRWAWAGQLLLPLTVLLVGLGIHFYPVFLSNFGLLPTGGTDSRLIHYFLEHSYRWLMDYPMHQDLWDPPYFSPLKNVLSLSDTLLGAAPVYWLFRGAGYTEELSYALWVLSMCGLNYLAAWAFLRCGLRMGNLAASLGAFMISFGSSQMAGGFAHPQLLCSCYTSFGLLAVCQLLRPTTTGWNRYGWYGMLGVCFAAQFYACYYLGYFFWLVLFFSGLLVWKLPSLAPFRERLVALWQTEKLRMLGCLGLASVLLFPLALGYLQAVVNHSSHGPSILCEGLPSWASYFYVGKENYLYGWTADWTAFKNLTHSHEHRIGLGWVSTGFLIWFLWTRRMQPQFRYLGFLMLLLTQWGGYSMGRVWYYSWPGIQPIRAAVRIGILLLFPLGIALAYWLHHSAGRKRWLALPLVLLCCIEQLREPVVFDPEPHWERVALLAAQLDGPEQAFLYSPLGQDRGVAAPNVDAMWAGLLAEKPTLNGYTGRFPEFYGPLVGNLSLVEPDDYQRVKEQLNRVAEEMGLPRQEILWIGMPANPQSEGASRIDEQLAKRQRWQR